MTSPLAKRRFPLLALALLLSFGGTYLLRSPPVTPPRKPHVFVNLSADHRADESIRVSILAAFKRTGVQNAVVIADRMPAGETMEDWAARLFKELGLGRANGGRAILYLFVPSSRELKIEVGYALEGVLTDADVGRLERAAKSFTFVDRYQDFWAELINTVNIRIQKGSSTQEELDGWEYFSGGAGVARRDSRTDAETLRSALRLLKADENAEQESEYAPTSDPQLTLQRYLNSLRAGVGDPRLPLLSTGSRFFRERTPMTRAQLSRNWRMSQEALPARIEIAGDRAIAVFSPGNPVLPVVFVRTKANRWLIHEPASWGWFQRFEDSLEVFQKFPGHPFAALLAKTGFREPSRFLYPEAAPAPALFGVDEEFLGTLERLQKAATGRGSAEDWLRLADFRNFELQDLEGALDLYREGLQRDPRRLNYRWRLLDLLTNLGRYSEFLSEIQSLSDALPGNARLRRDAEFYRKVYSFNETDWQGELPR